MPLRILSNEQPELVTSYFSLDHSDGEDLSCELPHDVNRITTHHCKQQPISLEQAQRMAEFLSTLADPTRLRLLSILAVQEMCVGDLALALEMTESAVSHQLRLLRTTRLVNYRKQGRHVFYRLQDHHVLDIYQSVTEHLDEPDS